jgi:hypothetical protein
MVPQTRANTGQFEVEEKTLPREADKQALSPTPYGSFMQLPYQWHSCDCPARRRLFMVIAVEP